MKRKRFFGRADHRWFCASTTRAPRRPIWRASTRSRKHAIQLEGQGWRAGCLRGQAAEGALEHAGHGLAEWTEDYNTGRPHAGLDYQTSAAFAQQAIKLRSVMLRVPGCCSPRLGGHTHAETLIPDGGYFSGRLRMAKLLLARNFGAVMPDITGRGSGKSGKSARSDRNREALAVHLTKANASRLLQLGKSGIWPLLQ